MYRGKKLFCLALACLLSMLALTPAFAVKTLLQDDDDRGIKGVGKDASGNYPLNPVIAGESPTTGLPWDGDYQPMLVQIDNSEGGTGYRAPWGATDVDITYETTLYRDGTTRISFLFSDVIPESAGPVRSARIAHVWLREEWMAGFLFYGGQEERGSGITAEFKRLGTDDLGVAFSGVVGNNRPWKKYYTRVKGLKAPHNVDANVAAIRDLIPETYKATMRPFLFTDELPSTGEFAYTVTLNWGRKDYASSFVYNEMSGLYYRYVDGSAYVDKNTGDHLSFSNVIIQRTTVDYNKNNKLMPITKMVGKGNADIFIGGRFIAGYWERTAMDQRTVYFDENGQELKLLRGKTFIAVCPYSAEVTYTDRAN